MRLRVLAIRSVLGCVFALLLSRFFFPAQGVLVIPLIAVLLVFFAYVFESIHGRGGD